MPRQQHTTPARETYVHPDDPAGYLKPDQPLMAGGYDWSWCFVWYKDIAGKPAYRVGHDGAVWSCVRRGSNIRGYTVLTDKWRRLKPRCGCWGHLSVALGFRCLEDGRWIQDQRWVHRLVLEAFVGPCPPGLECRHLDGNPANNRIENLCWGTRLENMQDKVRHGRSNKGRTYKKKGNQPP